jgi:ATP-binding cassette subfamily B protein/subfamily B ATP-binding cassette protein MsbA
MKPWWLRLAYYALPQWRDLALVLLLMFLGVALITLEPWPLKLIVDAALNQQPLPDAVRWLEVLPGGNSALGLLGWLSGATVLLFWSSRTVGLIHNYLKIGVGEKLAYGLGEKLFARLQRLSLSFHHRQRRGDLVRRVATDSSCVKELVMGVFLPLLRSCTSLIAMFVVMWQLAPFLSLLALAIAPPLAFLMRLFDRPMSERTYQYQALEGEMMALAEQSLTALPLVQAFGAEKRGDKRFRHLSQRTLRAYLRAIASQLQFKIGVSGVTAVGRIAVMLVGGFHVLQGQLTVGSLLVFQSYLEALYVPMETLAYLSVAWASAAAKARRVLEVLDASEQVKELPQAQPVPVDIGKGGLHVCWQDVTFGYEAQRPVLQGISLEALPGETMALVGPTGAGKTTLVSLIPRFFDPWQGRVLLNGVDVRQVQLASLRAQIGLVLQDPFLLPVSVAENIAYGCPSASREAVVAAAVAANADEFIQQLPQGYDTVIGEGGATLSGGQRQRLSIARALLKDAPVLILDEPTSALDAQTESLLLEALERLMAGRTTLIVAHRLSTIARAHRIVFLKEGQVVEVGTHEELLPAKGHYAHFYNLHRHEQRSAL